MRNLLTVVLAILVYATTGWAAAPDYEERTFTNEHLGKVQFVVPKEWRVYDRHHINFGTTFLSPEKKKLEHFEITFNDS
ncbi:MAG: hypothetical protein HY850_03520, partial [Betaproteobacteria bacterium]|nr:hypothetical protein [Betaproteobacteria bacterium]